MGRGWPQVYRQQYHFAITLRGGKIALAHEYLDTQHSFDVWLRPDPLIRRPGMRNTDRIGYGPSE